MEKLNDGISKKKSSFKRVLKILFILVVSFFALCAVLVALLFVYEDEVKSAIVSELNKNLKAEVRIEPKNIDLTIIKTFPDCSIEFKDVLMLEAIQNKNRDTLLFASQLSLHFNIQNLWNEKYEIQKIKLDGCVAKPIVFKNGKNNYTFWKQEEKNFDQKNDSMRFDLNYINIKNCRLIYKDKQSLFKTELDIKSLHFKGNFSDLNYDMQADGKMIINNIVQDKNFELKDKNCDFSLQLNVKGDSYSFKKAELNLNKLALELSGNFEYKDSLRVLDINYNAPNLDIASVLSLLPEGQKTRINDYKSSGNFFAKGNLKYIENEYEVNSDFGIRKGQITYKPQGTEASDVNLEGTLRYSKKLSVLAIKNMRLKLNNDEILGNCRIIDFNNPQIQFDVKANSNLENLQNFWPIDTISKIKGNLVLKANAEGFWSDFKNQTFSNKVKFNLDGNLSALEIQFKKDEKTYAIENCSVTAIDREIEVYDLKLKRGSSDINLSGKIPGIFNYLMDKGNPLIITGSLFSEYIKLEDFMPNSNQASESNENPLIPENMLFKLNAQINKFSFAKFEAQDVEGEIEIKNQKAIVSDMKLKTMEGEAEIDAYADNSKNKLEVVLQSKLKTINISQLFSQFNNFGQQTLIDNNIKGYASADIDFSGTWSNKLDVDYKTILTSCNLNIEGGELIDFRPLLSLSRYVEVQDLQRIKFSTLKSNIEIKNTTIIIPRTTIKNSALNIDFWGTHSFNDEIDYHIQLVISELLAKKRKNRDDDFGPIVDDNEKKRSAFILMTGTVDKPIIKYDKKGLKEKVKEDIKQEKQTIKQILKEEFGLFKKDSLKVKKNKADPYFELERNDREKSKNTKEPKKSEEDDEDF